MAAAACAITIGFNGFERSLLDIDGPCVRRSGQQAVDADRVGVRIRRMSSGGDWPATEGDPCLGDYCRSGMDMTA